MNVICSNVASRNVTSSNVTLHCGNDIHLVNTASVNTKFDQALVSGDVLWTFTAIVDTWFSLVIAFLGIFGNTLTIVVFKTMGFKDTINIPMTTIAFWDLVSVLCGFIHRFYGHLSLLSPPLGRSWQNATYPNINSLQNIATNIAYVIGAYVAMDRCLCISFPLRVKSLMTPTNTWLTCIALSAIVLATLFPSLFFLEVKWIKASSLTSRRLNICFPIFTTPMDRCILTYKKFNFLYPLLSLIIMVSSTLVIVFFLYKSSAFRGHLINTPLLSKPTIKNDSKFSKRDIQVVKMLLLVILTYALVLVPRVTNFFIQFFEPEFSTLRFYNNIARLIVYLILFIDFFNSSSGILIFIYMSSKFRSSLKVIVSIGILRKPLNKNH
ncbi:N-formyl peptide receptor 2 [Biomphalaria pfeifferi]|uniref:N-formyl peptide receptor 2 n=1 Tax=Biomphalaria pfeifferi TaxID=112525 RepID=A0AAD8BNI6_BIOPF|nr:N-formyl peptide receptor 2 [Biomphalaria pfeifferi]